MRTGAPVADVASLAAALDSAARRPKGRRDSKAGRAIQAPSPRRKCRRLRLAKRAAASFESSECFVLMALSLTLFVVRRLWAVWGRPGHLGFDVSGTGQIRQYRTARRTCARFPG